METTEITITQKNLPAEYDGFKKRMAEIETIYNDAKDVEIVDSKSLDHVHKSEMAIADMRLDVEKKRKELNEPALKWTRENNGFAEEIFTFLKPKELILANKKKAYKEAQERIKQEAIAEANRKEAARLQAIRDEETAKQKKIIERQQALNRTGAILENGQYTLGEVSGSESMCNPEELADEEFDKWIIDFGKEKAAIAERSARIERRKAAIQRTGAMLETVEGVNFYSLGEMSLDANWLINDCTPDEFSEKLAYYTAEAQKIQQAKDEAAADSKRERERTYKLQSVGGIMVKGSHCVLGNAMHEEKTLLNCPDELFETYLKEFQDEHDRLKKEREQQAADLARRERTLNRKEALAAIGANLINGGYELGKLKYVLIELENDTDSDFGVALTVFTNEARKIKEAAERADLEKKEAEEKKIIAKGEKRANQLKKYGLVSTIKESLIKLGNQPEDEFIATLASWKEGCEQREAAAEARRQSLLPDITKLTDLANELKAYKFPTCSTPEGNAALVQFKGVFADLLADFKTKLKTL